MQACLRYSWDIGTAHFIIFSTELYFFVEDGMHLAEYQYRWLEEDLKVLVITIARSIICDCGFAGCTIQERPSMDYHSWTSTDVLLHSE